MCVFTQYLVSHHHNALRIMSEGYVGLLEVLQIVSPHISLIRWVLYIKCCICMISKVKVLTDTGLRSLELPGCKNNILTRVNGGMSHQLDGSSVYLSRYLLFGRNVLWASQECLNGLAPHLSSAVHQSKTSNLHPKQCVGVRFLVTNNTSLYNNKHTSNLIWYCWTYFMCWCFIPRLLVTRIRL